MTQLGLSTAMGNGTKWIKFLGTMQVEKQPKLQDNIQRLAVYINSGNGNNTIADGYSTGYFNTPNSNPQADTFTPTNTAFVIGNGTFENAFKVLFDGTTTIAGDLNINSDARLKANIISLGATLSKLLQIDGKTYTMKKDANHKKKIGLLAQDIEKVFPELVTETNDIKSVNYQGLVPVLINAMKEQDEVIRSQNKQLSNNQML